MFVMGKRMNRQVISDLVIKVARDRVIVEHISNSMVLKVVKEVVSCENIEFNEDEDGESQFVEGGERGLELVVRVLAQDEQEEGDCGNHEAVFFVGNERIEEHIE